MRFSAIISFALILVLENFTKIYSGSSGGSDDFDSVNELSKIFRTQSISSEAESSSGAYQDYHQHSQSHSRNYRRTQNIIQENQAESSQRASPMMDQSSGSQQTFISRQQIVNLEVYRNIELEELRGIKNKLKNTALSAPEKIQLSYRAKELKKSIESIRTNIVRLKQSEKSNDQ